MKTFNPAWRRKLGDRELRSNWPCPECKSLATCVSDSRPSGDGIRRRRGCTACNHRWTTWERAEGTAPSEMPWGDELAGWSIVGMHHYIATWHGRRCRHLFVAMSRGSTLIKAEGPDEIVVFEELHRQAAAFDNPIRSAAE